ncbi:MAG: hypothetical protein ABJE00_07605 [Erythrobacter sp.]
MPISANFAYTLIDARPVFLVTTEGVNFPFGCSAIGWFPIIVPSEGLV